MTELEKVIEILEKAKMVIEDWVPMFEQYNTPAGIDVAIALLKEQKPIKPRYETIGVDKLAFCGNCDTYLGKVNFCPKCGKKVRLDG